VALITFMVSHLSNVDVLSLKRKEIRELHPCLFVPFWRWTLPFTFYLVVVLFVLSHRITLSLLSVVESR
jgi:hypothetical protein